MKDFLQAAVSIGDSNGIIPLRFIHYAHRFHRPRYSRLAFACSQTRFYRFKSTATHSTKKKLSTTESFFFVGDPNGIRTRVAALRGPRPRPLDDGTKISCPMCSIIYIIMQELFYSFQLTRLSKNTSTKSPRRF